MSAREAILASVRAHRPALSRPRPIVPTFAGASEDDLREVFGASLERMGGRLLAASDGVEPLASLRAFASRHAVVCSRAAELEGNRSIGPDTGPADLVDVDLGIVRAAFAVAETGSVCLTEAELGVNTLGYLPQHLLVLLDPHDIVAGIHDAYRRAEWHRARYAVFQTGPSATADIEGVLIHGAQGVRSLSVAFHPRGSSGPVTATP